MLAARSCAQFDAHRPSTLVWATPPPLHNSTPHISPPSVNPLPAATAPRPTPRPAPSWAWCCRCPRTWARASTTTTSCCCQRRGGGGRGGLVELRVCSLGVEGSGRGGAAACPPGRPRGFDRGWLPACGPGHAWRVGDAPKRRGPGVHPHSAGCVPDPASARPSAAPSQPRPSSTTAGQARRGGRAPPAAPPRVRRRQGGAGRAEGQVPRGRRQPGRQPRGRGAVGGWGWGWVCVFGAEPRGCAARARAPVKQAAAGARRQGTPCLAASAAQSLLPLPNPPTRPAPRPQPPNAPPAPPPQRARDARRPGDAQQLLVGAAPVQRGHHQPRVGRAAARPPHALCRLPAAGHAQRAARGAGGDGPTAGDGGGAAAAVQRVAGWGGGGATRACARPPQAGCCGRACDRSTARAGPPRRRRKRCSPSAAAPKRLPPIDLRTRPHPNLSLTRAAPS